MEAGGLGPAAPRFRYDALPGRVFFGAGAARTELARELADLDVGRVLVLTSERESTVARALVEPVADRIAGWFTDVRPHVPVEGADAARASAEAVHSDALLCIGGGSTIGTAKAVALTSGLPIIAVPTTYAGSEMTPVWGMTEGGAKTTGTDMRVLPKVVLYDPELTLSLPAGLSSVSGLNALAHCVEAFWAAGRNPVTTLLAEEGIRALGAGLPRVLHDGRSIEGRSQVLYGSYLAGAAFAAAGSGLHHKICHVLGGAFDLAHAQTHAVVLPYVLAFNAPAAPEASRRIAAALGADDAVAGLTELDVALGAPRSLAELGMPFEGLEPAAAAVVAKLPFDNPRTIDVATVTRLLTAAWRGDDPVAYGSLERP